MALLATDDPTGGLETVIEDAREAFKSLQREDGHWVFEFEPDATISAEYIFLQHHLDKVDEATEAEIARFIRSIQGTDGGWPLFHDGAADIRQRSRPTMP